MQIIKITVVIILMGLGTLTVPQLHNETSFHLSWLFFFPIFVFFLFHIFIIFALEWTIICKRKVIVIVKIYAIVFFCGRTRLNKNLTMFFFKNTYLHAYLRLSNISNIFHLKIIYNRMGKCNWKITW